MEQWRYFLFGEPEPSNIPASSLELVCALPLLLMTQLDYLPVCIGILYACYVASVCLRMVLFSETALCHLQWSISLSLCRSLGKIFHKSVKTSKVPTKTHDKVLQVGRHTTEKAKQKKEDEEQSIPQKTKPPAFLSSPISLQKNGNLIYPLTFPPNYTCVLYCCIPPCMQNN